MRTTLKECETVGSVYKQRGRNGRLGRIWWIKYYRNGKPIPESAGTAKETEARRMLKEREGRVATGQPISRTWTGFDTRRSLGTCASTEISSNFVPFLRERLDLGLNKEDAVEIYYNASITRWLNATLDLQIIDQALKKQLDSAGRLTNMKAAVILGLRLYARF
jgi:hypothetical protein